MKPTDEQMANVDADHRQSRQDPENMRKRAEGALEHAIGRARMHLGEALKQASIAVAAEYVQQEDPAGFILAMENLERGQMLGILLALDLPALRVLSEVGQLLDVIQPGDPTIED